jgi:coenzyme F420 hydrogenase subunit beta
MSEMPGFNDLNQKVITTGLCVGCAACVVSCPVKVLSLERERSTLVGECTNCGMCLKVCPRYTPPIDELEKTIFGRTKREDEPYGVARDIFVVRVANPALREKCQDGGTVTGVLTSAMRDGTIDGAAVAGFSGDRPWMPVPAMVKTPEGLAASAGTRYTYSPNLLAFREGVASGLQRIAFVGTPCQILASRRIEQSPIKRYSRALALDVGLFCSESFSYDGLMVGKIQGEMGVKLTDLTKMNIKGKILLHLRSGEAKDIPLKEARQYAEPFCKHCRDFAADLADISCGGVGLDGWTATIVRTDRGATALNRAVETGLLEARKAGAEEPFLGILKRLAVTKRDRPKAY